MPHSMPTSPDDLQLGILFMFDCALDIKTPAESKLTWSPSKICPKSTKPQEVFGYPGVGAYVSFLSKLEQSILRRRPRLKLPQVPETFVNSDTLTNTKDICFARVGATPKISIPHPPRKSMRGVAGSRLSGLVGIECVFFFRGHLFCTCGLFR